MYQASIKRPGYYVEGRYYGTRIAQAIARAEHLSREFGRKIFVESAGIPATIASNGMSSQNIRERAS